MKNTGRSHGGACRAYFSEWYASEAGQSKKLNREVRLHRLNHGGSDFLLAGGKEAMFKSSESSEDDESTISKEISEKSNFFTLRPVTRKR